MLDETSRNRKRLNQTFPIYWRLTVFDVDIGLERVVFDDDVLDGVGVAVDDQVPAVHPGRHLKFRGEETLARLIVSQPYGLLLEIPKRND